MKRLGSREFLLFALPFVLLLVVALRPSGPLRLEQDHALFAQEVARKIPVGMSEAEAVQLLKSSGFSSVSVHSTLAQVGNPRHPAPKRLRFIKTQTAFLHLFASHAWEVSLVVQDQRVRNVQGGYY